jgi:hypothetical protein
MTRITLIAAAAIMVACQTAAAAPAKHVESWQCPPGYICTKIEPVPPIIPVTMKPPIILTITEGEISLMEGAVETPMADGRLHVSGGSIVIKMPEADIVAPEKKK